MQSKLRVLVTILCMAAVTCPGTRGEAQITVACQSGQEASFGHCCEGGGLWDARYGQCAPSPKKACAAGDLGLCVVVGKHYADPGAQPHAYDYAVPYFRKACSGGQLAGCTGLGYLALYGRGRSKNPQAAQALFERACKGGHRPGCTGLAERFLEPDQGTDGETRALALFKAACEESEPRACAFGALLAIQDGRLADEVGAAQTQASRACQAGSLLGCSAQAWAEQLQSPPEPASALAKRAQWQAVHRRACEAGEDRACWALGDSCTRGEATLSDMECAEPAYRAACKAGLSGACTKFAALLEAGPVEVRNVREAQRLYRVACKLADGPSCLRMAQLAMQSSPGTAVLPSEARLALYQACRMGRDDACVELANRQLGTVGGERQHEQVLQSLTLSCNRGHGPACVLLGDMDGYRGASAEYMSPDQLDGWQNAAAWLAKGCAADHGPSCERLGLLAMNGHGTARDFASAAQSFERSCKLGESSGCLYRARQFAFGHGLKTDATLASELLKKACQAGAMGACGAHPPGAQLYPSPYRPEASVPSQFSLFVETKVRPKEYLGQHAEKAPSLMPAKAPANKVAEKGELTLGSGVDLGFASSTVGTVTRLIGTQSIARPGFYMRLRVPVLFATRMRAFGGVRSQEIQTQLGNLLIDGSADVFERSKIKLAAHLGALLPTASVPASVDDVQFDVATQHARAAYNLASAIDGLREPWLWAPDYFGPVTGAQVRLDLGESARASLAADIALLIPIRSEQNVNLYGRALVGVEIGMQGLREGLRGGVQLGLSVLGADDVVRPTIQPWLGYALSGGALAYLRLSLNPVTDGTRYFSAGSMVALNFGLTSIGTSR